MWFKKKKNISEESKVVIPFMCEDCSLQYGISPEDAELDIPENVTSGTHIILRCKTCFYNKPGVIVLNPPA